MEGCDLLGEFAYKHALKIFVRFILSLETSEYSARVLYKNSLLLMGSKSSRQCCVTSREVHFTRSASYKKAKENYLLVFHLNVKKSSRLMT